LVCGLVLVITAVPGAPGARRLLLLSSSARRGESGLPPAPAFGTVDLGLMANVTDQT
jgi:hypothetical protein